MEFSRQQRVCDPIWVSVFKFWKIIALSRFFDHARVLPNRHRQIPALLAPFYAGGFAPESQTSILAHRNLPRPSLTEEPNFQFEVGCKSTG